VTGRCSAAIFNRPLVSTVRRAIHLAGPAGRHPDGNIELTGANLWSCRLLRLPGHTCMFGPVDDSAGFVCARFDWWMDLLGLDLNSCGTYRLHCYTRPPRPAWYHDRSRTLHLPAATGHRRQCRVQYAFLIDHHNPCVQPLAMPVCDNNCQGKFTSNPTKYFDTCIKY
jgi:hypothetical protein